MPQLIDLDSIHEIQQVLYRYAVAIDTQQLDLFDACFVADARIELHNVGIFDRETYKRLCREALPDFDATHHVISNPLIKVDGNTARSRCYFTAQHARNNLAPMAFLIIGGWYDDEFSRVNGRWLITNRVGTAAWYDGNPAVLGYSTTAGALERVPGRECPPWLHH